MKNKLTWLALGLICLAIGACSKFGSKSYISVQLEGSKMWSLLDVKNGEVIMMDELSGPASDVVKGSFFVQNAQRDFDLYNINDTKNKLNPRPYNIVTNFCQAGFALVKEKGAPWEVIDTEGNIVGLLDKSLNVMTGFSEDNLAVVTNGEGMTGYVDTEGKLAISPRYKFGSVFSDGVAIVCTKQEGTDNSYSAIDATGNVLFTFSSNKYSAVGLFQDGYAFAVEGDNCILIDKTGLKVTTVCKGTDISRLECRNGKMTFVEAGFYGLKDLDGKVLIRAKYKSLKFQDNGDLLALNTNGMYGVVDADDEVVMPFNYEAMACVGDGRYVTRSGAVCVMIDGKGKEVCNNAFSDYLNRSTLSAANEFTALISAKNNRGANALAANDGSQGFELKLADVSALNALYLQMDGALFPGEYKGLVDGKTPVTMQVTAVNGNKVFGNINYPNEAGNANVKSTPFFGFIKDKNMKIIAKGQKDSTYDEDWNLQLGGDKLTGTITSSSGKSSSVSLDF